MKILYYKNHPQIFAFHHGMIMFGFAKLMIRIIYQMIYVIKLRYDCINGGVINIYKVKYHLDDHKIDIKTNFCFNVSNII